MVSGNAISCLFLNASQMYKIVQLISFHFITCNRILLLQCITFNKSRRRMSLFEDEYLTIEGISQSQFRDRGSRFIGIAYPVSSEAEIKDILDRLKKEYYDATHHCYAYVLGPDKSAWRFNDDGEPSGTAGRPIYGQIISADLTNILVVVIRYYGGTKLGVPGLINAYKTTAKESVSKAVKKTCIIKDVYSIEYDYAIMNDVMKTLKEENVEVLLTNFGTKCVIEFAVRKKQSEKILHRLSRLTNSETKHLKTI